ncbi:M48 family metalloprotease [Rubrivirga sp.]|uniref:M48 family metalloprotease n=1 Tax=Rubrivirga sp. TaxID=1885344 RepID=UPI003C771734
MLAITLTACGTTNQNFITGENQRGAYSWQQERELGAQADQQIIAQFGLYTEDPELTAYVERVAQNVLETSAYTDPSTPAEVRSTPFVFRILDSPVVNAFALPGGFMYVTRGLLTYLENEAQLAVVLGHEIGHVLGRHSSEQAARAQLNQFGLIGAAVLGGVVGGGNVAQGILEYGSTGLQLLQLKWGRGAEREADMAGVAYAEFAGYDAAEAARFFRALDRLSAQSGGGSIPNFMSTHPDPAEREQTIPQLANSDPRYQGEMINAEEYLRQIEGVVVGEDPRQGYVEDGAFYHPELRFRFDVPRGWQTQNSPMAFVMGEPNGQALIQLTLASQSSAEAAARELASQQGVQVGRGGATTVNGNRAYRLDGAAQQQNGTIGFVATFIEYGGNVYQILGLTAQNALQQYGGTFVDVSESFSRLTDQRYLNRQPSRLEVTRAPGGATISSLLRGRTLPSGLTEEEVAIMNQVELNQPIPTGQRVKLPE